MLSFPSLLVSAGLIAISLKVVLLYSDDYYSWGFAVVFGAIVSCSDPMEVVRLLNDASAPKKFISLV
jgi:NhaP-type Na+/H+ or K+/H+ antiporter